MSIINETVTRHAATPLTHPTNVPFKVDKATGKHKIKESCKKQQRDVQEDSDKGQSINVKV